MNLNFLKSILVALVLCAATSGQAQVVRRLDQVGQSLNRDSLAAKYYDAVLMDPSPVMDVNTELFMQEWSKFVRVMGRFLYDKHFQWGSPVKGNLEVYFSAEGKIDLLLISLRNAELSPEKWKQLFDLLNLFVQDYHFGIQPKAGFSNMGSFQYAD